ncbi:RNA 2'-phosphotransferase [Streptomyces sp. SPB074]|uniref:RNA 2'-phosphotransferase n=1 Tax=Streptomyces sp. (strain SPB074) TaxID=465543 RepID=UPI00017F1D2B|nr:RNA 2'-phosphotransferase [Streptomyces sp. SPB074]EDY45210.1 RNA 2'-phosphotransferase [Streptomyces sp. SPB074]
MNESRVPNKTPRAAAEGPGNTPATEDALAAPLDRRLVALSRFLSRHLRHAPDRIGITLDHAGWTGIGPLLEAAARHGLPATRADLARVVAGNDKRRFAVEGDRIRAQQGHSVPVDLGLVPLVPPPYLFHGTAPAALAAIRAEGLRPMRRHHVHLSADRETARRVGARRGRPVVLTVRAGQWHEDGATFLRSGNGVWLTAHVPPRYLGLPEPGTG